MAWFACVNDSWSGVQKERAYLQFDHAFYWHGLELDGFDRSGAAAGVAGERAPQQARGS